MGSSARTPRAMSGTTLRILARRSGHGWPAKRSASWSWAILAVERVTPSRTSAFSRPSPRTWAWRWRTRASSMKPSSYSVRRAAQRRAGGHQRDRRGAGPSSSTSRGSSTRSASGSARSSRPNRLDHPLRPGAETSCRLSGRRRRTITELEAAAAQVASARLSSTRATPLRIGTAEELAGASLTVGNEDDIERVLAGRPCPRRRPCARSYNPRTAASPRRSVRPMSGCCRRSLEHGRGARERAAVRRDKAPSGRDRAAQRRAGGHQRDRRSAVAAARLPGNHRRGRRQDSGDLRRPDGD